jgi:hypothetical protein
MDELIARVSQAAGVDAEVAKQAVGYVLGFLQKEGPVAPVSEVLGKIPGAAALAAQYEEPGDTGGGGLMGSLMGNSGGLMGLAGKLTGLGLGVSEMQAVGREIFSFAREKAGEDVVGQIAGGIPGLSQFI